MLVLCTHCVLFRFHSLKYYIFTFRHNINNVQREKQAGMRSCVRACLHAMSSNTRIEKPISLICCSCCCIDNNSNNGNHNNAHKQKKNTQVTLTENTLGSISLTRSEGVSLIPTIHIHFEPVFTPLQIKCHYGAYSI